MTTNAEKQARFRKKEALKQYADKIFREWQIMSWNTSSRTPVEVRTFLDKAVDLQSGWTDEDYENALRSIQNFYLELYDNPHLLDNDVKEGRNTWNEFKTTPDPRKFMYEEKANVENTRALAAHIISALKLTNCSDSDQAAALMEAIRFVGRSLLNNSTIYKSNAVTMCLASIGSQYARPEWFAESLAKIIAWNIGEDLACDVGEQLKNFDYGI
jgi:hypothetical protein